MTRLTKSTYTKIVLVILLCVLVCGTLTGAFGAMRMAINSLFAPWRSEQTWVPQANDQTGSFSVDATSVQSLSVDWLAGSLTITVVPDDEQDGIIKVTESGSSRIPLRWRNTNGNLEIDYGNIPIFIGCSSWSHDAKDLVISIPESYARALDSVSVNAASGRYSLAGFACNRLNYRQASGSTQMSGVAVNALSVSLASGNFDFNGTVSDVLDFEQASGRSKIALAASNPSKSDLDLASGSMDLALPSPDFQLNLQKLSGSFNSEFELTSRGNTHYGNMAAQMQSLPAAQINLDMASGNFNLCKSK